MAKKAIIKKNETTRRKKSEFGDVIRIQNVGTGSAVAAGRGAKASVVSNQTLSSVADWIIHVKKKIDSLTDVSQAEKEDIKNQIEKIGNEVQKGSNAEVGRLEKLINTISVMAPDIFDIVIATLANPLAGIGLVIKKVGEKAKLEKDSAKS